MFNRKIVQVMIHSDRILFSPLPQLHMANILINKNIRNIEEIITLEFENGESIYKIFSDIIANHPAIVTFSCYLWNFKLVEQLCTSLKQYYGDKICTIVGGPHLSEDCVLFIKKYYQSFDILVGWYGERPITEIVSYFDEANGNIKELKDRICKEQLRGIYFYHPGEGLIVEMSSDEDEEQKMKLVQIQKKEHRLNGEKNFNSYNTLKGDFFGIRAGDFIPFNNLSFAHKWEHLPKSMISKKEERVVLFETYRGCSFQCNFCLWGEAEKKLDYFPADRMIKEFNTLLSYGFKHFSISDAGFGLKKERDIEFLKYILSINPEKLGINMSGYFFWQTLDNEFLDIIQELIKKKIIGQLDLSIQTFEQSAIDLMHRPTNYQKFHETIQKVKKRNIPFQMDLILGLPGSNLNGYLNSVRKTMNYRPTKFQTFPLYILPGSGYDKRREELGIKTLKGSRTHDTDVILETKTFPLEDINQALRVESYFYLTYTLRLMNKPLYHLADITSKEFFDVVMSFKDWSSEHSFLICELVDKYYRNLYEDRHRGRKELDIFLLENFNEIHNDIKKFFIFYLEQNSKNSYTDECLEFLAHSFLVFPKKFEHFGSFISFPMVEQVSPEQKEVVVRFQSNVMLNAEELEKVKGNSNYLIKFSEPRDTNFRFGGISTQYEFWRFNAKVICSIE